MQPSSPIVRVIENASIGQNLDDEPIGSPAYCMITADPVPRSPSMNAFPIVVTRLARIGPLSYTYRLPKGENPCD